MAPTCAHNVVCQSVPLRRVSASSSSRNRSCCRDSLSPLPGTRWAYACTDLRAIDESVRVTLWGTIFSVLYSASRRQRFKCRDCGELFYSHTPVSSGYQLLFVLSVALIAVWIVGEISEIMSGS